MNTVITEARVTLNSGLFSQNIVILSLQIANDLLEAIAMRMRRMDLK